MEALQSSLAEDVNDASLGWKTAFQNNTHDDFDYQVWMRPVEGEKVGLIKTETTFKKMDIEKYMNFLVEMETFKNPNVKEQVFI